MQTRDFIKFSRFARILPQMLSNTKEECVQYILLPLWWALHTETDAIQRLRNPTNMCSLLYETNRVLSDVTKLPIDFNVHTANNPTAIRRIRIIALIANTYHIYNCELPFHVLFIIQCMPNITLEMLVVRTFHTLPHSAFIIGTGVVLVSSSSSLSLSSSYTTSNNRKANHHFLLYHFTFPLLFMVLVG